MVDAADLQPGAELLEPTSGNTGISLALVAKLRGSEADLRDAGERDAGAAAAARALRRDDHRLARRARVERRGAVAQELAAADDRYMMLFQYANEANPRAHYEGTGAEIVRDLPRVDALVAGLGTGGTLMGTGAPRARGVPGRVVAAAEPLPGDPVMGLRSLEDGYVPPILDVSKLDRKLLVSNAESVAAVRALLDREGIFAGVSAGAVVHVARRIADELPEGSTVVARARRRRLEVPLGRRSGTTRTSRTRWSARSGGNPGRDPRGARARTRPRRRRTSAAA